MGIFSSKPQPQAQPVNDTYTLANVQKLLEHVGMLRLRVRSPVVKVMLTHIAKSGELYLKQQANGSAPSSGQIVPFVDQLDTLSRVVERHIVLESVTDYSREKQQQLAASLQAVKQFALSIDPRQRSAVGNFMSDVDLQLLKRQTRPNS